MWAHRAPSPTHGSGGEGNRAGEHDRGSLPSALGVPWYVVTTTAGQGQKPGECNPESSSPALECDDRSGWAPPRVSPCHLGTFRQEEAPTCIQLPQHTQTTNFPLARESAQEAGITPRLQGTVRPGEGVQREQKGGRAQSVQKHLPPDGKGYAVVVALGDLGTPSLPP